MSALLRKISPATVCPDLLKRLDVDGAPAEVVLYDIYGMTNKVKSGSSEKGEWTQFRGEFEAVTPDGEVFVAGGCFLPEPIQSMLHSQMSQAQVEDKNASVKFAVRVSIVKPAKGKPSVTGYEYRVKPIIESNEESPLKALREAVAEKRKQLTA
jgi:hypothetical protein